MSLELFIFRMRKLFLQRYILAQCGHQTPIYGYLKAYGTTCVAWIDKEGEPPLCLECLNKEAIPCAWCGQAIFPGDAVMLCSPRDPAYQPPPGSVTYSEDPLRYVGCLRVGCSDGGLDRQGFWMPPEGVQRVLSPLEQCIMRNEPVIINNLSNLGEANFIQE